jgi:transcriptional regulator with XRE-family HTH domain
MAIAANPIPEDELAELWFGFKHQVLEKLQTMFRVLNLRQDDVARRIGKDPATISRCLRGRRDMDLRTMHDLARGMGCRLRVELDSLDEVTPRNRRVPEVMEPGLADPMTNSNSINVSVTF